MNIGMKLKENRIKADLSQEYVADKLKVTRQTISNWENNKSYPDILNIIELSNLYSVSLDELIKEDKKMVEHLEESLNVVNSQNKLSKQIMIGIYLIIWVFSLLTFWIFTGEQDAIGYSFMVFYVLLPISSFIISIWIGKDNSWDLLKYFMPILFGVMYMLAEYTTFSLANMTSFNKINLPEFRMIIPGAIISYLGIVIGLMYTKIKKK